MYLAVLLSTSTLLEFLVNVDTAIPNQVYFPLTSLPSSCAAIRKYYLPTLTSNIHNDKVGTVKHTRSLNIIFFF
jgi:hypothetical protein